MPKKLTYKFVKSQFEKENYIPKFTEYINNRTKLDYTCPEGHKHSVSFANWGQGYRCPYCSNSARPLTYTFVKEQFEQKGCIPLFTDYVNCSTKLDYICLNGHEHSISWDNFKQGKGCPKCAGVTKPLIEPINQEFDDAGYILLTTVYINNRQKLNFICPNGHRHSTTWKSWSKGKRCGRCKGNIEITYEEVKQSFESVDYIPEFIEYKNSHTKLSYTCPNGHRHSTTWSVWNKGFRCPSCSYIDGTSKFEKDVKQFIYDNGQEIIENDRTTILNPDTNWFLELDILFPCKTKAIECNGVYWHNLPKIIEKDKIKNTRCQELGINLLTITDEMWYNDREKCEDLIKNF